MSEKSKVNYPIGGFAPGHYICKCILCAEEFIGDKRSVQCEPCAINSVVEENRIVKKELFNIKDVYSKLEEAKSSIDKIINNLKK